MKYISSEFLASRNKRILNFLIDLIIIQTLFFGTILLFPNLIFFNIDINLIYFIFFIFYYFFCEFIFDKTLGKIITQTKVIHKESKNKFVKVLIRTLTRIFILEIFTFLSKKPIGLHDEISNTRVVLQSYSEKSK